MIIKKILSYPSDERKTPDHFFDEINHIFGFTLDPCATYTNTKCGEFFTLKENGLIQEWSGVVFCNPPYSKSEKKCGENCTKKMCKSRGFHLSDDKPGIYDWIEKCKSESELRKIPVVVLVSANGTGARWFQDFAKYTSVVVFIPGRLSHIDSGDPAKTSSMLMIFGYCDRMMIEQLEEIGTVLISK